MTNDESGRDDLDFGKYSRVAENLFVIRTLYFIVPGFSPLVRNRR